MAVRLTQYLDVRQVLDSALSSGGGSYALDTHGAAVHWRHRAYTFRKKFYEQTGDARYDVLLFKRVPQDSSTVMIELVKPKGTFVPAGRPVSEPVDDLTAVAEALAKKLDDGGVV